LNGEEGELVCKWLMHAIGTPIGKAEAVRCQKSATSHDPATGRIAACASCNEILFECDRYIVERQIEALCSSTLLTWLTKQQVLELHSMDQDVVQDVVSVVKHKDTYYHLNPDLIPDPNVIVLCSLCASNALEHDYSIASGHDYPSQQVS